MSTTLFFPPVIYVPALSLRRAASVRELCQRARITCKASGAWTERPVEICVAKELRIWAEPGDWGKVRIGVPTVSPQAQVRLALAVLAYGLHDLVAKESLRGLEWARPLPPRGRPRRRRAMSAKERQRRFRAACHRRRGKT